MIDNRKLPKSKETIQRIKDGVKRAREANPSWKEKLSQTQKERYRLHPEIVKLVNDKNTKYFIGDEITFGGYVHVNIGRDKWMLKHRQIMEVIIGRKLLPIEHIHHIDKNPLNNSPENLKIVTNNKHTSIHHKNKVRTTAEKIKQSETRKRLYAEGKLSRDCSQMHTEKSVSKMAATMKQRYAAGVKMGWALMHERNSAISHND